MTTDLRRLADTAATVRAPAPQTLDYYLILPETGDGEPPARADGIVVEEFVLAEDFSAVGLDSAGWTPGSGGWFSSASVSRSMRADPDLRARVVATGRQEAQTAYRQLGGGALPDEETLRTYFLDRVPLVTSAPLRLRPGHAADGYQDTRVYRILFAGDLRPDGLANLQAAWRMRISDGAADPGARVIGTAALRVADDAFAWDLRRVGPGVAWCLDLTADLGGSSGDAVGPLLRGLTTVMRRQGLVPVTVERFS